MKKVVMMIALLIITGHAMAQPVSNVAYKYIIGDTMTHAEVDTTDLHGGSDGPAQLWDYSTLTETAEAGVKIKAAAQAVGSNLFPGADYAHVTDAINTFFKRTDSGEYVIGAYAKNITTVTYTNSQLQMMRPLVYGQPKRVDSFMTQGVATGSSPFKGKGVATIWCDAFGVLTTPEFKNVPVVRARVEILEYDTISSPAITTITHTVSFVWFDTVHAAPLLQIDSFFIETAAQNFDFKSGTYLKQDKSTAIKNIAAVQQLQCSVYGNSIVLHNGLQQGQVYRMVLTDQSGKMVTERRFAATGNRQVIDSGKELPAAIYIVQLISNDGGMSVGKVIKP